MKCIVPNLFQSIVKYNLCQITDTAMRYAQLCTGNTHFIRAPRVQTHDKIER